VRGTAEAVGGHSRWNSPAQGTPGRQQQPACDSCQPLLGASHHAGCCLVAAKVMPPAAFGVQTSNPSTGPAWAARAASSQHEQAAKAGFTGTVSCNFAAAWALAAADDGKLRYTVHSQQWSLSLSQPTLPPRSGSRHPMTLSSAVPLIRCMVAAACRRVSPEDIQQCEEKFNKSKMVGYCQQFQGGADADACSSSFGSTLAASRGRQEA
jgi:hypothetical protein